MNRRKFLGLTAVASIAPIVAKVAAPKKHPLNWIPNGERGGPHMVSHDDGDTWRLHAHLEEGWYDEMSAKDKTHL